MQPERWQQIEKFYHAALEHTPDERANFLKLACAGDEALRREVASLLGYDEQSASFIEAPVLQVAARELVSAPSEAQPPAQIGVYQLLAPLGRGGMGEVHLALDTRLNRKVAVKLLPAEFTTDAERVRRFAQEARAASALNHPNIITIHEIGESEHTLYIVMEYVEGETLRQRLARDKLPLTEALAVALQIAEALTAAHEAGITHRDIKPENVMVRPDSYVKVLDFGLAKLTEPAPPVIAAQAATVINQSTDSGLVLGTPRYMSPEQARGEKVDGRSDLFSLGVLLYEMVAGHAPFTGATTGEVIAALLRDEPPPLMAAPPELARIVSQLLRKDRAERYQTAGELLADLKELKQRLEFEKTFVVPPSGGKRAAGAGDGAARRFPPEGGTTNKRRRALIIAVAALVITTLAGWLYFQRAPALTEKDAILLADFENQTGEEIFDKTLKQGLAIQLQQSPFLHLFPEARVRQTLREMNRPPDARVTAELAREICERHNLTALITGALAPLGSHYVITLEALNGHSGESLAHEQVEAESREHVLRALSQAATQLRTKLGESLSSIQRFNKPLEQVTTSKLEAFKAWSLGIEHSYNGRALEAVPFYQRAVELDPDFASAWSVLSTIYYFTGRPELAAEYAEKGYALRERVGEYEKLRLVNFYHGFATGDLNKRLEALALLRQMYPREAAGSADLTGTCLQLGQYEQGVAAGRDAIRVNPHFAPSYAFLTRTLVRLGRFAEARELLAQAFQQKLDNTFFHALLYEMAFIDNDAAEMQRQLDWTKGKLDEYRAFEWQAGAAAYAGQGRQAQEFSHRAIELSGRGDTQEVAAQYATEQALRGAVFGDCRQTSVAAAQGLKLARGRASLPRAALALALCGAARQAQPLVDELSKRYPADTLVNSIWLPAIRAALELQRGNAAQAIEQLQATTRYEAAAEFWPQYLRGQAYLQLQQSAEAVMQFQQILDHRGYAPLSPLYPLAQLGLARATHNRKAYADFLALWKNADADLPRLSEARKEAERVK